jgi:leucyl aminopeptidase
MKHLISTDVSTAPNGSEASSVRPVYVLRETDLETWRAALPPSQRVWVQQHEFRAERHRLLPLPATDGALLGLACGLGNMDSWRDFSLWHAAPWPERLPPGSYQLEFAASCAPQEGEYRHVIEQAALGWMAGSYRYACAASLRDAGTQNEIAARLCVPKEIALATTIQRGESCALARDLINAPANDLGPEELGEQVARLGRTHGAEVTQIVGEDLLSHGYPLIHAVGRASVRAPRLIDLRWGDPSHPRVTLVGKGVCFDSGGLDIKPASGMLLMKKDMGGAAIALGLAQALMARSAPIRLRLLIPAVENAVGGAAFRPGDVLPSRSGLKVEIGNTDAEGRLVLADALTEADRDAPQLLLDFATLTGAARVALGPELPALFTDDETLREQIVACGRSECDPVWPLPMWSGYDDELGSRIADLNNVASSSFAGAIFGALFLRRFVTPGRRWAHFDLYAWNPRERPGRPVGAEAQCLRLADKLIENLWG